MLDPEILGDKTFFSYTNIEGALNIIKPDDADLATIRETLSAVLTTDTSESLEEGVKHSDHISQLMSYINVNHDSKKDLGA